MSHEFFSSPDLCVPGIDLEDPKTEKEFRKRIEEDVMLLKHHNILVISGGLVISLYNYIVKGLPLDNDDSI